MVLFDEAFDVQAAEPLFPAVRSEPVDKLQPSGQRSLRSSNCISGTNRARAVKGGQQEAAGPVPFAGRRTEGLVVRLAGAPVDRGSRGKTADGETRPRPEDRAACRTHRQPAKAALRRQQLQPPGSVPVPGLPRWQRGVPECR